MAGDLDLQVMLPAGIPMGIPAGYLCGPSPVSSLTRIVSDQGPQFTAEFTSEL